MKPKSDHLEAWLRATEIAVEALLAEVDELRDRLAEHDRCCSRGIDEIRLT